MTVDNRVESRVVANVAVDSTPFTEVKPVAGGSLDGEKLESVMPDSAYVFVGGVRQKVKLPMTRALMEEIVRAPERALNSSSRRMRA